MLSTIFEYFNCLFSVLSKITLNTIRGNHERHVKLSFQYSGLRSAYLQPGSKMIHLFRQDLNCHTQVLVLCMGVSRLDMVSCFCAIYLSIVVVVAQCMYCIDSVVSTEVGPGVQAVDSSFVLLLVSILLVIFIYHPFY